MLVRSVFSIVALGLVAAFTAGCNNAPTTPSSFAPFSQTDLVVGTGTAAAVGNTVTVNYTGWLYNPSAADQKGAVFDSSLGTGGFQFVLGAGQVIPGWDIGVAGMKVGGVRRLVVPPSLGYGGTRNGPIPPNATLIFEVELADVVVPAT
jgi:FKBP-type peptidyl-prolyl cis-trans isomerase FkpA